ncbi:TIGR00180 family glycosyltransferase [Flavobacterium sp. FlaQc-28]|uniref:TIGR00180 family glycosyltransferase n=1 Tax=Flavobacterium sp. FlaQc-28 TaxID=3374178 RepID=UPI00375646F4
MNERYTVIIPEHNRPDHLKRLLDYFLSFNLKIIVADSSNVEFKYLDEFYDKIIYKFYPKVGLADKLYKILPLIDTPYVVMCANDDFLVPQAIEDIISYLEIHKEYNSGQGIYTDFTPLEDSISCSVRYKNTMDIDLNNELPSQRLLTLQGNYFQYYYSVFRKSSFSEVVSSVIVDGSSVIKNLCLLESYISSYTAIDGKHIIIPSFYSARENIEDSAASHTDTIPVIIKKKKYKKEYLNYLDLLSKTLASKENLNTNVANDIVIESVSIYVKQIYPDFFTIKGKTKYYIKEFLKEIGVASFLRNYRYKELKEVSGFPADLKGKEHWDKIKLIIQKYDYLYKK